MLDMRFNYVTDEQGRGDDRQDTLNEVIMAIDMDKDGMVDYAYYIVVDGALVLREDVPIGGLEAVNTILLHVQPTLVIVSNRALAT